ncbi:MAG: substrate-binding domain-containing protein [Succinivibrio sp.]|nr:substrate-binding domain-containing protein [Succinivibrio sp.]
MIKRPKLQDIAKQVGVTKMTVSRFFNDPNSVALKTRERISEVIEEMGFIPNRVPAIMSKSSSKCIGLVIPSFSNLVFAEVIDGVEETAVKYGYSVLLMHSGYDVHQEEQKIAELISYQVDGLILSEPEHTPLTMKRLLKAGIPIAEIMSLPKVPLGIACGIEHQQVATETTLALIESGRRHIAYFGARMDKRTYERQEGYLNAVKQAGLQSLVYDEIGRSNFTTGHLLLKRAMQHTPPDAIICTNDDVAMGVLMGCQELKLKVPDDLSIIGYNGLNVCEASTPKLCSIATPRRMMGQLAMEKIIAQLEAGMLQHDLTYLSVTLRAGGTATAAEQQKIKEHLDKLNLVMQQNLSEARLGVA